MNREEAIETLKANYPDACFGQLRDAVDTAISALKQSEIIRCGQCKYAEVADKEDAQDGYTCQFHRGSIWFSGSYCSWAERKDNGRFNQQTGGD